MQIRNNKITSIEKQASYMVDQGNLLLTKGRYEEALMLYQEALSIYPDYFRSLYNTGLVLGLMGKLQESATFYKKAIDVEPEDAEAYSNLGVILRKLGQAEEAANCYRKALEINPEDYRTHNNLGVLYRDLGSIEESLKCYKKAININPEFAESLNNLGVTFITQGKIIQAINYFKKSLAIKPQFPESQIYLAIIFTIKGDWETCEFYLNQVPSYVNLTSEVDNRFVIPYHQFLNRLIKYKKTTDKKSKGKINLPKIYAIGDSHCLSISKTKLKYQNVDFLSESKIVIGCKAWHLANSQMNRFKYEFERKIESVPNNSISIFIFGEIDCRINEGIINNYKTKKTDLNKSITKLVECYFKYILDQALLKNISPIFCNIPYRIFDQSTSSNEEIGLHRKVVDKFNCSLKDQAAINKTPLLDIYSISKAHTEKKDYSCHIDDNHLKPFVFQDSIRQLSP